MKEFKVNRHKVRRNEEEWEKKAKEFMKNIKKIPKEIISIFKLLRSHEILALFIYSKICSKIELKDKTSNASFYNLYMDMIDRMRKPDFLIHLALPYNLIFIKILSYRLFYKFYQTEILKRKKLINF